jgi:hypothetical protein
MKAKNYVIIMVLFSAIFISKAYAQVEVPEEILNTVPIYQGAKVIQSMQMQGSVQAVFEVHAGPKAVITYLKDAMQQRGWNVVMQMDMENTSMATLTKDNVSLMFNAFANQGEKTRFQILLETED